jgi:hypothetical protein
MIFLVNLITHTNEERGAVVKSSNPTMVVADKGAE